MNFDRDFDKFSEIMAGLACILRDSITEDYILAMFKALNDLEIHQVDYAAKVILKTRIYTKMPTPAEFYNAIDANVPDPKDKAIVIAHGIIEHLNRHGSSVFPIINDPIALKLMKGRWEYHRWSRDLLHSEEKWWIREFVDAYCALSSNAGRMELIEEQDEVKKLIGNLFEEI